MSNCDCQSCFNKYQKDHSLLIEEFEDYQAGNYGDGDREYYSNYMKALHSVYEHPDIYSDCQCENSVVEFFTPPNVDFKIQNQLFNSGDYVDYYHNLYNNV